MNPRTSRRSPALAPFACATAIALALAAGVRAQAPAAMPPASRLVASPPLQKLSVGPVHDLGLWDQVYLPRNGNYLVVRRGDALFRQPPNGTSTPALWHRAPLLAQTTVFDDVETAGVHWLFCSHEIGMPFALDPVRGTKLVFDVPGLTSPPDQPPHIQSMIALPHLGAALVMIAGGQQDKWPLTGNGPIYFLALLQKEQVVRMPVGWQLNCFDATMERAACGEAGFDLRTGEASDCVHPNGAQPWIAFEWTDRDSVQPIRTMSRDREAITGVNADGVPFMFGDAFQGTLTDTYRLTTQAAAGWVTLDAHRQARGKPENALWFAPLRTGAVPELVAHPVHDHGVLAGGRIVFVSARADAGAGAGNEDPPHTAYVWDAADKTTWDVMEGIDGLPPLDPEQRRASGTKDQRWIGLHVGRGHDADGRLALAVVVHDRRDPRDSPLTSATVEDYVPPARKHQFVLLTSAGERAVGAVPGTLRDPAEYPIWRLGHDGWLLLGRWSNNPIAGQIQIDAVRLRVQPR